MHAQRNQRLNTDALSGAGRDAGRLVELVCAGEDFQPFLDAMTARRAEFVKSLARPTIEKIRHYAVGVAKDSAKLDSVPVGMRAKARQYADTMIRRRRSVST